MRTFHNNTNAVCSEQIRDGRGNLAGQALLNLESAREHFGQSSKFGKTNHMFSRNIANMYLPRRVNILQECVQEALPFR